MYRVYTTTDILTEVLSNYRKNNPLIEGALITRLDKALRANVHEVIEDYFAEDCPVKDIGDFHVHAAASTARVMYLITQDAHFLDLPEEVTDQLSYEILSPDDFFCLVDDSNHEVVRFVALEQVKYWSRQVSKGRSVKPLQQALIEAGCPNFAQRISQVLNADLRIQVAGSTPTNLIATIAPRA